ncbi:unnamed protein product [Prunus brigantina]
MLKSLGFTDRWVELIMDCISTVTYSVQILSMYERASGQKINFDKSAVCFSPNTDPMMKQLIAKMLGVSIVTCHECYLGLPTLAQCSKSRMFNHVREQICQNLCQELSAMIARYWWGKSGRKGIHWLGWRKLCKPKCLRGLGFIHFEAFNKSMVAKQAWRILQNPTSLVAKILKARYFPEDDFMQASLGSSPSMIWKSIMWGREVIEDGLLWRVGNGASIRVLRDRWIPKPFTFKPLMTRGLEQTSMVSDLLTASGSWNLPLLEQHFSLEDRDIISGIALGSVSQLGDSKYWFFSKNKKYFVKTGYRVAVRQCDEDFAVGGSDQMDNMVENTMEMLEVFKSCEERSKLPLVSPQVRWLKPRVNTLLLNCDGAVGREQGGRGLRGCCRDHNGNFICGFASFGPPGLDVLGTELVAVREGLLMMGYMGFTRFTIGLYSQEAVSILKDGLDW